MIIPNGAETGGAGYAYASRRTAHGCIRMGYDQANGASAPVSDHRQTNMQLAHIFWSRFSRAFFAPLSGLGGMHAQNESTDEVRTVRTAARALCGRAKAMATENNNASRHSVTTPTMPGGT